MKLLIFTQKVNGDDPILGFFVRWIKEFSSNCEKVTVICLEKGEYDLPSNVNVYSLGKEEGKSKIVYLFRFYKYILATRNDYDSVFVHMNQIYVILGGLFWRLLRKKIGLWYAHGHVSFSLRIATILSHIVFTSTKSGFRIETEKLRVVGQGIDTEVFKPAVEEQVKRDTFNVISIGRVDPIKDYETLINAADVLVQKGMRIKVSIVGDASSIKHKEYVSELKKMVSAKNLSDTVHFLGAVPNKDIVGLLKESDLFASTSNTGSLDKAMLEAMAVGLPTVSCNEAMLEVFGGKKDRYMYKKKDFRGLSEKISFFEGLGEEDRRKESLDLRNIVVEDHSVGHLIDGILSHY